MSEAPGWVQTIKCADLISNTSSIVQHDPEFAALYLAAKQAQGYDDKPPRCGDCAHFVPCGYAKGGRWIPPICEIGRFAVQAFGICDLWRGTNGETLEQPAKEQACKQQS